jgi:transcriptional regulator with XRE-family HTH domain
VTVEEEPHTAGQLIRFWRTRRRLSQLELALDANLSTTQLSFVENGRSRASRQLLIHLAQHLDLPMAERNRLLLAGGFAPPYLELPYDGALMQPLGESLRRLLDAHQPNPALIVDGLWNLIEANPAASLLWDGADEALLEPPINMLRLAVHPGGLPRISSMTAACSMPLKRLQERVARDAEEPRPRRLGPRLVARHRAQSSGEGLSGQVERGLGLEDAPAKVAVDRVHVPAIEDAERPRRVACEHQQLLIGEPLQIHPFGCMTDRRRA